MRHNHFSRTLVTMINCSQVSTGRDSTLRSLYWDHSMIACSRHIHVGVVLRTHFVHGESHIQRNTNQEVATAFPPFKNFMPLTRVIPMLWSWWETPIIACEASKQLIVLANGDNESLVISIVVCCHSVKLCILATWTQHKHSIVCDDLTIINFYD